MRHDIIQSTPVYGNYTKFQRFYLNNTLHRLLALINKTYYGGVLMTEPKKIRDYVSKAYAKAVTAPSKGCCCGCGGYSHKELKTLPSEVTVNSFGCGNPLAFADIKEGNVVLDLGSGAGLDVLLAAKKVGPKGRAIGIDMTDEMIFKARKNIVKSGLTNVEVIKGIIEKLPVESKSVDWVISNCVINLSPEKSKVFSEIARVLKPGGQMLISDIVAEDIPDCLRKNRALYNSCIAGAISEKDYLEGLRNVGLENVEVKQRIIYDLPQLTEFIQADPIDSEEGFSCGCGCISRDMAGQISGLLAGKIWSAKFYALKPLE